MRILRVIGSMDPAYGGPCQGIRNSIPALKKLGVENEVVTLDDPSAPFISRDPFQTHALGPAKGPWQYGSRLVPWLLDNLSRFDIVIVHGLWLYYSRAAVNAVLQYRNSRSAAKMLPKLFVMPHGMLDPYFQRAPDRRLKAIRNWVYWKLVEHKLVNEADGILFTCEAELLLAREPFRPYHPKRELNVGYGIQEPPAFTPAMRDAFTKQCPQIGDKPYILYLSRVHEKKGVDMLIKAYARIRKPDTPMLVIAGPGMESDYGQKLIERVKQNHLEESILFAGMVIGDAKWGAFYGCDCFILPSHQENFGIAVVEALACGKTVLISNQVNIWREIKAAGAGIVANDTEEGTLELLMKWDELNEYEEKEMCAMARQCFERLYAIGPAASRLLETFQNEMTR